MSTPKLLGISGSLRAESYNTKLIRAGFKAFGAAETQLGNIRFPLYDGDAEASSGIPEAVHRLADQIKSADGILIATPEYNKGISGALKNALDWVSRVEGNVWQDKPVAIMSAAAGRAGGERAQIMLRWALFPFKTRLIQQPEVLVGAAHESFDGDTLTGELNEQTLKALMDELRREIARPALT